MTGIGQGLTTLATSIFLTTTGTGSDATTTISTFGVLVVVFAGIALATGLCRSRLIVPIILGGNVKSSKNGEGLAEDNTVLNLEIAKGFKSV